MSAKAQNKLDKIALEQCCCQTRLHFAVILLLQAWSLYLRLALIGACVRVMLWSCDLWLNLKLRKVDNYSLFFPVRCIFI